MGITMSKKVLVTVTKFGEYCAKAKKLLEDNGFEVLTPCVEFPRLSQEELLEVMPDIDAVIMGLDDWNEDVFGAAKKLKIMSRFGLGVDNVDLESAKRHGVYVCNARASFNAVSELAMSLLFCCLRTIPFLDKTTKEGKWERFVGDELFRKKVGLLGFGVISQTLAKRLSSFECDIYAYDLAPNRDMARDLGVTIADSIDEVLAKSEIISLHLPATPSTAHLVDRKFLGKCNKGAYIINTARGAILDEKALYDALVSGHIRAAGTDVFEHEPVSADNPLLKLPNFYCTPHQGAETIQTMENVGLIGARAILDTFQGKKPQNLLNG